MRVPSVSTAAARTFASESQVSSMSVAFPSSGYGPKQRRSPEADERIRVTQEREQLHSGERRQPLELGGDPRALAMTGPECFEQKVDRPLVADVPERADGSPGDLRIRIAEDAPDQPRHGRVMRLLEAL